MKLFDQHIHTRQSMDSKETIENYLYKIQSLGIENFIQTDHLDINPCGGPSWIPNYDALLEEYKELGPKFPNINLMVGIECGYKKDKLPQLEEIIHKYNYDLINLSVHEIFGIDLYSVEALISISKETALEDINRIYLQTIKEAIGTISTFDVMCHIDYAYKTSKQIDSTMKFSTFENELISIFKELVNKDKVLEINGRVQESINDDDHILYILNLYKKCGGKHLTFSSDAHKSCDYLKSSERCIALIKKAGFDHLCYFIKRKRYELAI